MTLTTQRNNGATDMNATAYETITGASTLDATKAASPVDALAIMQDAERKLQDALVAAAAARNAARALVRNGDAQQRLADEAQRVFTAVRAAANKAPSITGVVRRYAASV